MLGFILKNTTNLRSNSPDFTECFEKLILIFIPSIAMVIAGPLWLAAYNNRSNKQKFKATRLNLIKLVTIEFAV